jgi:hypothetical protein
VPQNKAQPAGTAHRDNALVFCEVTILNLIDFFMKFDVSIMCLISVSTGLLFKRIVNYRISYFIVGIRV